MMGSQPTVGCIVFLHESKPEAALRRVLSALDTTLSAKCQSRTENKWIIKADLGAEETEGFLFALEDEGQTTVFLEFDEEECIQIASRSRLSLESIFLPYVNVLKEIPDAIAVGIGFEMAVPTDFIADLLEDAGIAVLFEREELGAGWQRRDVYYLTGHTEQPFVGAAS